MILLQANVGAARCKENAFIRVLMDSIADSAIRGEKENHPVFCKVRGVSALVRS